MQVNVIETPLMPLSMIFTLLFTLPLLGPSPLGNALASLGWGLRIALLTFSLARFGLLVGTGWFLCDMLALVPLTADTSA